MCYYLTSIIIKLIYVRRVVSITVMNCENKKDIEFKKDSIIIDPNSNKNNDSVKVISILKCCACEHVMCSKQIKSLNLHGLSADHFERTRSHSMNKSEYMLSQLARNI